MTNFLHHLWNKFLSKRKKIVKLIREVGLIFWGRVYLRLQPIIRGRRKFFYISQKKLLLYVLTSLRLYVRLYVREFKKFFPNTFIYESILIKIYMNTNIIFYRNHQHIELRDDINFVIIGFILSYCPFSWKDYRVEQLFCYEKYDNYVFS